jgi:hypothetical protein
MNGEQARISEEMTVACSKVVPWDSLTGIEEVKRNRRIVGKLGQTRTKYLLANRFRELSNNTRPAQRFPVARKLN